MFRLTAEAHTAAEHFSRPIAEHGKNSFEELCTFLHLRSAARKLGSSKEADDEGRQEGKRARDASPAARARGWKWTGTPTIGNRIGSAQLLIDISVGFGFIIILSTSLVRWSQFSTS